MQLEKVTAEIRPRGRWESIDLGCALVRENYGKVMSAWFVTVIPIWFTIIALSQFWPYAEGRPWVAGIVCVWILPLCDRVPLFVLSRRLFGEDSTTRELLKALPVMFSRRFFSTMLLGPFAMARGLSQPVMELEGLKGKAYKDRVNLLSRNGGEGATQASLISLLLVLTTMFSMLFVVFSVIGLFGDSVVLEEFWVDHVLESDADFMAIPYVWILVGLTLSAVTLIEPFYVGAGFAMYINSRTITEGWDIELAFKRMSDRINNITHSAGKSLLLVMLFFFSCLSDGSSTEIGNPRLAEVLEHEDFEVHTEIVEVPVRENQSGGLSESSQAAGGALSLVTQLLFWGAIAALVGGVIWLICKNAHVFERGSLSMRSEAPKLRSIMGMDVTPESLPDDIVNAARRAWDGGNQHLAMSLLYRGAISRMVHERGVEIGEDDTENDCLAHVRGMDESAYTQYFTDLTHHWVRLAYAKQEPAVTDFSQLCTSWPYNKQKVGGER